MRRMIRAALDLSPLTVVKAVLQPSMVPVRLLQWREVSTISSTISAASELFPEHTVKRIRSILCELYTNHDFYASVNRLFVEKRFCRAGCGGYNDFLYLIIRLLRPKLVVETGVWDGQGTSVMLQALKDNENGNLISIDLPATVPIKHSTTCIGKNPLEKSSRNRLPPGCLPGWTMPDYLRDRHELILGDSKEELGPVLEREDKIDIFVHDSLHTYEHMTFEYECVWPHLRQEGLLISHDIFDNPAFYRFAKRYHHKLLCVGHMMGAIRK